MRIALFLLLSILPCISTTYVSLPPREIVNFDFAWKYYWGTPSGACPPNAFPKNCSNIVFSGLKQASGSTAEECMNTCCLDPTCTIWQFEPTNVKGGGCWIGGNQNYSYTNSSKWIGGCRHVPAINVGPAARNFSDGSWEVVDAPHDPVVGGTYSNVTGPESHAYLPQNVTWYRKHFNIPSDWKGQSIWVYFDGVFRASTVFLNGEQLLAHDSGYTSFSVRLDNASTIFYGDGTSNDNVIALFTTSVGGSGWWYEGGGIYRHAYLVAAGTVHFVPDGLYGGTNVTGNIKANDAADPTKGMMADAAILNPIADVINDGTSTAQVKVQFTLYDASGASVATGMTDSASVGPNQVTTLHAQITVQNIQLWTAARTYLYTLEFTLMSGSTPSDSANATIGFRRTRWDATTGFYLNDAHFKWRGFCDHNDFTGVGVAVPDRVNLFRAQMVKAVGGNAWRMSHNPPTPPLLDILDRLGIVVWDENRNFGNNTGWMLNQRDMVRRDRNHPSVMVWSFCNEGGCAPAHGPNLTAIGEIFKKASKDQDSYRPVSANIIPGIDPNFLSDAIDVTGFSHQGGQTFDNFHSKYPSRPMIASECCSCTTQRGEDVRNTSKPTLSNFNGDCDSSQTGVQYTRDYIAGTLVWTLFDYYGEPSDYRWPQVSSAFGSIDLAGFAKASAFWYRAWWLYDPTNQSKPSDSVYFPPPLWNPATGDMEAAMNEDHNGNLVHIVQSWDPRPDGDNRTIQAYSNAPMIELFLNGKSLGMQNVSYRQYATWKDVPFSPGNLTAVARTPNGDAVAWHTVLTSGEASSVRLTIDVPSQTTGTGTALLLDGTDAGLVRATILDAKGNVVRTASHNVTFRVVSGPGRIIGVGNGNPMCHEPNQATWRSAFHGLARAVVRVTENAAGSAGHRRRLVQIDRDGGKVTRVVESPSADSIVVEASVDGLGSSQVSIPVSTDAASDSVLAVAAKWMMPH